MELETQPTVLFTDNYRYKKKTSVAEMVIKSCIDPEISLMFGGGVSSPDQGWSNKFYHCKPIEGQTPYPLSGSANEMGRLSIKGKKVSLTVSSKFPRQFTNY